ncbi:MAG: hypothetical protein AAGF54_07565 [Pseudomonadota bacterium]
MSNHEVIVIDLNDEDKRIPPGKSGDEPSASFRKLKPSFSIVPQRGWSAFQTVAKIESGKSVSSRAFFLFLLAFVFLLIPHDPDSSRILMRNESVFLGIKIAMCILLAFAVYVHFWGNRKILITPGGFYYCFLWRKTFVPWVGCGEFTTYTILLPKRGLFTKAPEIRGVRYTHKNSEVVSLLNLNIPADLLCRRLNDYRETFLEQNEALAEGKDS